MLTVVIFIAVLALLVLVHELGHFWTARRFGVKSEEFGFGFPPRLFGWYRDNNGKWKSVKGNKEVTDASDTVYSLNLLPLGGFVKIKGENGDSEDPDSFPKQKIWKRAIILSAGVAMNVLLAAVIFSLGFAIGLPGSLDGVDLKNAIVTKQEARVVAVIPESPANQAGLQAEDVMVSLAGQNIYSVQDIRLATAGQEGKELAFVVKRGSQEISGKVKPEFNKEIQGAALGVEITATGVIRYPWYLAPWYGFKAAFSVLIAIFIALFQLLVSLFSGHSVGAAVGGPIKIAKMTGEAASFGFSYLMNFVALLSLNLAVINILPLPALDGGRLVFLLIERIKGSAVKKEVETIIHSLGFWLLIILMILITYRDLFH